MYIYIYKLYINLKLRKLWQIADQLRRSYFITTDLITFSPQCNNAGRLQQTGDASAIAA